MNASAEGASPQLNENENGGAFFPPAPPVTSFIELTDAPDSYAGQASKVVSVRANETGLEFTTPSATGDVVGPDSSVDGAIAIFDGTTGKQLAMLEFASEEVPFSNDSGVLQGSDNFHWREASQVLSIAPNGDPGTGINLGDGNVSLNGDGSAAFAGGLFAIATDGGTIIGFVTLDAAGNITSSSIAANWAKLNPTNRSFVPAQEGVTYKDSGDGHLYCYCNGSFKQLDN